jgi:hypothetical protein
MLALAVVSCAGQATAGPVDGLCAALARQAERTEGIPSGLVEAVALAESGRWFAHDGTTRPWPWTITAGSDSFFLSSKPEALRKVHELRSQGRSNIDVGCMQINLGYHGDAFASVADALEPAANVAYGAQFLKKLREETQSWARATARYHSRHPQRGQGLSREGVSLLAPGTGRARGRSGADPSRGPAAGRGRHPTAARAGPSDRARPDARGPAGAARRDFRAARRDCDPAGRLSRRRGVAVAFRSA